MFQKHVARTQSEFSNRRLTSSYFAENPRRINHPNESSSTELIWDRAVLINIDNKHCPTANEPEAHRVRIDDSPIGGESVTGGDYRRMIIDLNETTIRT
ncbi:hypothetical protein [Paraburkholderia sp. MM5477-R1]|uniref:hypothetical protein n=1 Tax=Paraburkholderia sp. MM5477-R1 TaxID=2991062 RepID=UPI003D252203